VFVAEPVWMPQTLQKTAKHATERAPALTFINLETRSFRESSL